MMNRIYVPLEMDERNALRTCAEREKRDPRQQAALFIRQSLERLGLLPPTTPIPSDKKELTHVIKT